jgi:hypothetical protein
MEFVANANLGGRPHIIVDGFPKEGTVLCLSHWRDSQSPIELRADLSTEIVYHYLARPDLHVDADIVSTNHFDEDAACSAFVLLAPEHAERHRETLIDAASVGDFGSYRSRAGVRLAFMLNAFMDGTRSPLDPRFYVGPDRTVSGVVLPEVLARMGDMLDHPERFSQLWETEEARLDEAEARIDHGEVSIEEVCDLDLAIVRIPADVPSHVLAIHNRTERSRILEIRGHRRTLRYRYEAYVDFCSRPVAAVVELHGLCRRLNEEERRAGWSWREFLEPMELAGEQSSLEEGHFLRIVEEHLRTGARVAL